MVFLSLVTIGLVSARLLPLEYFPAVDVPFIAINIPYQGSTPEEVEREITRPVEEVLATLSGIKRLDSRSSEAGANIEVVFDWGQDVAVKAVEAYAVALTFSLYLLGAGNLSSVYYPRAINPERSTGAASRPPSVPITIKGAPLLQASL